MGMALFFMDSQDIRKEVRPDRIGMSRKRLSAKLGVVPRSRPKKVKSKFWIWLTKSPPMDENAAGFCADVYKRQAHPAARCRYAVRIGAGAAAHNLKLQGQFLFLCHTAYPVGFPIVENGGDAQHLSLIHI